MKKILFILLIFAFINSIGQEVNSNSITKKPILFFNYGVEYVVDSASIIGKPIIIGNLIVAQNDIINLSEKKLTNTYPNEIDFYTAWKVGAKLGNGWRLPTKYELDILYQNRDKIGGFSIFQDKINAYWSSEEFYEEKEYGWCQSFDNGNQSCRLRGTKQLARLVRGGYIENPVSIIEKPIRIGKLIIAENDFPKKLNWVDAKKACASLGKGWRLPTLDELKIIYQQKDRIHGLFTPYSTISSAIYWSSTEKKYVTKDFDTYAIRMDLSDSYYDISHTTKEHWVRAVRDFSTQDSKLIEPPPPPPPIFAYKKTKLVEDSASIIGKSIKIGKILVAQYFFKKMMNWNDAKKACASLGKGWRLPNQEELNILYQNRNEIGGFIYDDYWCSKEHFDVKYVEAWFQNFGNGAQDYHSINHLSYVRAVRTF